MQTNSVVATDSLLEGSCCVPAPSYIYVCMVTVVGFCFSYALPLYCCCGIVLFSASNFAFTWPAFWRLVGRSWLVVALAKLLPSIVPWLQCARFLLFQSVTPGRTPVVSPLAGGWVGRWTDQEPYSASPASESSGPRQEHRKVGLACAWSGVFADRASRTARCRPFPVPGGGRSACGVGGQSNRVSPSAD